MFRWVKNVVSFQGATSPAAFGTRIGRNLAVERKKEQTMAAQDEPGAGRKRIARLYKRDSAIGLLLDMKIDFVLWEKEGVLPDIGDKIIDPGVLQGKDRRDPLRRTVYEVVGRYYGLENETHVAIVVKERTGLGHEEDLLGVF